MKMRNYIICLVFPSVAFFNTGVAQSFHLESHEESSSRNNIILGFENELFASNLTNSFFKNYWSGSFISTDDKNKVISKLEQINDIGWRTNFSMNFQTKRFSSGFGLRVGAELNSYSEASFSRDAFILYYKGNKSYEGKTAILSPLDIFTFQYAGFKIGAFYESEVWGAKIDLGILNGLYYLDHNLRQSSLYTEEYGRRIELIAKLQSFDVDPAANTFANSKTFGLKSDAGLFYRPFQNTKIFAAIEGLGSIQWKGIIRERLVDTIYSYEGTEISGVLDSFAITGKGISELKSDFLKENFGLNKETTLPFKWQIGIQQNLFADKIQISLYTGKIKSTRTQQFIVAQASYMFIPGFLAGGVSWKKGSYGTHGIGLIGELSLLGRVRLVVGFDSLQSFLDPEKSLDISGYARLKIGI